MTFFQWLRAAAGLCLGLAGGVAPAQTPADFAKILPAIQFLLGDDIDLTIVAPADGSTTTAVSVNVSGTVFGPAGVAVQANGVSGVVTGTGYTVSQVPLTLGVNTIKVTASAPNAVPTVGSVTVNRTAQVYNIFTDHLNTPRLVTNTAQQAVWRWDNNDPFGGNPPDENPSGLGAFVYEHRFPGQVANKETGTFYNYFRDCYDPATGRYCQPDPIGIIGQIRRNSETARHHHFMAGKYDLATDESVVTDLRALGFMPEKRTPETDLYSYVGNKPLSFTDPTGEIIREAAIIITATAIGITLYATYDCAKKCEGVCPIPQNGDPQSSRGRDAWILNCKIGCVKAFGGFLRKYGSPTPPIDPFIVK